MIANTGRWVNLTSPCSVPILAAMDRERLDILVHERGLAESRELARRYILAGQVTVNGRLEDKPGTRVGREAAIVVEQACQYVSRGGLKLEAALSAFAIDPTGWVVGDVGASTGGFTDCLLQKGAARVYAIDVGYGQLAWRLRLDPRVVVMERVNVRYLRELPEPLDLVTIDVSFISLRLALPPVLRLLKPAGQAIALIKPQFEAGRQQVGKGGVVRDAAVHRSVLEEMLAWAATQNLSTHGLIVSPLRGPAGNIEFLVHWSTRGETTAGSIAALVESALSHAARLQEKA
ncbi:MAG: Hemolysin A [Chloroflexi bacterium ADurb.Bin180]|nr:MAG: Hemolysin A [Chloroflexi bacterium ADurb.Bin180]